MTARGQVDGMTAEMQEEHAKATSYPPDQFVPTRTALMEYYRRNRQDWVMAWLCGKDVDFPFGFEEIEAKVEN